MTQPDCISNRNLKIIDAYVKNRLGREYDLFEGLSRPDGFPPQKASSSTRISGPPMIISTGYFGGPRN